MMSYWHDVATKQTHVGEMCQKRHSHWWERSVIAAAGNFGEISCKTLRTISIVHVEGI